MPHDVVPCFALTQATLSRRQLHETDPRAADKNRAGGGGAAAAATTPPRLGANRFGSAQRARGGGGGTAWTTVISVREPTAEEEEMAASTTQPVAAESGGGGDDAVGVGGGFTRVHVDELSETYAAAYDARELRTALAQVRCQVEDREKSYSQRVRKGKVESFPASFPLRAVLHTPATVG